MSRTARTVRTPRRSRPALVVAGLVAVAALLAACGPAIGKPALRQAPNTPRAFDNSDPAVLVANGTTYLFGSTNNKRVPVRVVPSLAGTLAESQTAWARDPRDAMPTRPSWVDAGEAQIWAPSAVKIGSTYFLYFAAANRSATTDESNDQCVGRARATTPMGPYAPEATPIFCGLPPEGAVAGQPASNRFGRGALDPEVFRDAGGKLHLAVALSRTTDNIATVPLRTDGTVSGGTNAKPAILVSQSQPWHDGYDDGVRRGGFLENPSMVHDPATNTYLLFFSAGSWWTEAYNTSFARCATPAGPCTQDTRGPFLKNGNGRTGIGGLTVFRDAGGTLRVAYASWQRGAESPASNPLGTLSRHTHWATLRLGATSDPAAQSVSLG